MYHKSIRAVECRQGSAGHDKISIAEGRVLRWGISQNNDVFLNKNGSCVSCFICPADLLHRKRSLTEQSGAQVSKIILMFAQPRYGQCVAIPPDCRNIP